MPTIWPGCETCRPLLLKLSARFARLRQRPEVEDLAQEVCLDCLEGRVKERWKWWQRSWVTELGFKVQKAQANRSHYQWRRSNELGLLEREDGERFDLGDVSTFRRMESHAEVAVILAWADRQRYRGQRGPVKDHLGEIFRWVICGDSMRQAKLRVVGIEGSSMGRLLDQLRDRESS